MGLHEDDIVNAHYYNPDFSEDFLSDFEQPLHIELPYPIHKPLKYTKTDTIQQFFTDLERRDELLSELSEEFDLVKDTVMNQSFADSYVQVSKGLLNFCNGEKFEVPFTCKYNPFYATGCLDHFRLNNTDYLIRPDCKNNIRITNLTEPQKTAKLNLQNSGDGHVTGISSSELYLLLRLDKEVNLIEISNFDDVQEIKWKKRFKRQLLDAKYNSGKLGVVSGSTKLRLYDIHTNTKFDLSDYNIDGVTRIDFIGGDNVSLLGEKYFKIIDLRSQDYQVFQPKLSSSSTLSSAKIDDNQVYLASSEHLIQTDLRFFKDVQFCSHLMITHPCYIDVVTNDNRKYLCLSSQNNEKVLFSGNPISTLPLMVPSICDTLNECQLKEGVLLKDQLEDRCNKSVFGIKLHCHNDGVFLYSANSLGEIFCQKISSGFEKKTTEASTSFKKWTDQLSVKKTLHLTNIKNLSHVRFVLNKEPDGERLSHFRKKNKRAKFFLTHFRRVYNKKNVGNLVANFMAPWEDDEEEREVVDMVPEVAPIEKVNSWIQSSYFFE